MGRETNKQRRERQAASAREKAAVARAEQRHADQRRRALSILSSVVVVAVVGVVIVVIALHSTKKNEASGNRVDASPTVVHDVTSITPATFSTVGSGTAQLSVTKPKQATTLTVGTKPELLFIGGEFCPICAAERWSMTAALSRFGTFSNLSQLRSAADDGDIATLSFYKSTYTSKYLAFTPVENVDRDRKPLQNLTSAEGATYRAATGSTELGYPFLDFGGQYIQNAAGYDGESVLGSMNQQQIAAQLKNPSSPVTKAIVGEANNLTAAICTMTNNQPASVCSSSTITAIQGRIASA